MFWLSRVSEILKSLCNDFLPKNVSAILYLMNYEKYGRSTASAQYFLQLAGYLGIPVIAWNADNSGLERVSGCKSSFPFLSYGEKEEEGRGGGRKKYSVALTKLFSNLVYENGWGWKIKAFYFRFSDGISPVFLRYFYIVSSFYPSPSFVSFPRVYICTFIRASYIFLNLEEFWHFCYFSLLSIFPFPLAKFNGLSQFEKFKKLVLDRIYTCESEIRYFIYLRTNWTTSFWTA